MIMGDASANRLGFVHTFTPAAPAAGPASAWTILLLHGTGGDENDLIPLGRAIAPGAALLSPRGNVLEGSMPRFFRRLAEGVFDQEDLTRRTAELVAFVRAATAHYGLDAQRVIAAGFSNGANIAASVLLREAGVFRGALLLSPMLPFEPTKPPVLDATSVFIGAGQTDPIVPVAQVERLAELLRGAGADVALHWEPGGHGITQREVGAARRWVETSIL